MAKLLIILFSSPDHSQNTDTVYELSKAAVGMKHEVTVFFDADATHNLLTTQPISVKETSAGKIVGLIKRGVHVLACRESARLRGINIKRDCVEGVVESSLGKLAELMESHDRIISFG